MEETGAARDRAETTEEAHGRDAPGAEPEHEPSRLRELFEKLEERREYHAEHGRLYRVAFALAGFTVFLGGLALLVLPGPAFAVIPVGLAMLALEFAWAEKLLEIAIDKAEAAGKVAKETSKQQRAAGFVAMALAAGAAVAAAFTWDIPLLPF